MPARCRTTVNGHCGLVGIGKVNLFVGPSHAFSLLGRSVQGGMPAVLLCSIRLGGTWVPLISVRCHLVATVEFGPPWPIASSLFIVILI